MAGTLVRLGWSDPLTDTFGAHPLLGNVLDLNDGQTYTLLSPQGLNLSAPERTLVSAGNARTQGEAITRAIYRHNRQARMQVVLGPASSYAELVATIRALLNWLNAPPAVPFAVQWQPFGASEPGYLDVVGAAHNIPSDEAQWLRLQVEPVEITLIVRPGIRYPRQTLSNLAVNPGFEAPSGPAVTVFNDALANVNAYASQAGAAPSAGSANNGYADVVMADAPLRYYRMQEASGATAYDVSGQGQNGTYQASPTLGVTSPISGEAADKAITLNGTSQYLSAPTSGLPSGSGAVSLEVWFRITANPATNPRALAFLGTTTASQALFLVLDTSGRVSAQMWGGATTPNSSAVALNAWHHAVLTYTGGANGTLALYLDGSSVGTATITASVVLGNCEFGRADGSVSVTFLPGSIDEVAVYAAALSAARVLAHWNAGNAGTGMGTTANTMTLASGARVSFGSPSWMAINTWQTRFRFVSGLTARWYLHYTDANNYLRASLSGTALTIEQMISGVTTTLATTALVANNLVWYWLRLTQFPAPPGDPACVQAVLLNDAAGTAGATVATAGPIGTVDAVTALSGKPQIEASGAPLVLGGPFANVHAVSLFGPGGWLFANNGGSGTPSGAWEHDPAQTYPSGPVTSYGAGRVDFPPGGTVNCYWHLYGGGATAGQIGAIPVATAGDTLGIRARVKSSGLGGGAVVRFWVDEYDASGSYLRTAGITMATPNTDWATMQHLTYVTGASCAYVDLVLQCQDTGAPGNSANATIWWDNVQVWNVTKSGQANMPYCELRFPQSPCQLLLTGLVGDLLAPAMLSFGTYLASFTPGNALSFGIGRRGQFSAAGQLVGHVHGYYGTLLSPTAIGVLDAGSYGGYYAQALVQASWNPRAFSFKGADIKGVFHLFGRFLSKQILANIANVQLRAVASQQSDAWFNKPDQSDVLANYYGPFASLFSASNAWTVADTGQIAIPPYPQGALTDAATLYHVPRAQWADSTAGGASGQSDWEMLLPVDGSLLVGVVNNPGNAPYTPATSWVWSYFDGLLVNRAAVGDGPAWTYSLEMTALPAPSRGAGGPGTQTTGFINVNSGADPYLTLDPSLGSATQPGANQLAAYIADASGTVLPFFGEVTYAPLYLQPR